MLCIPQKSRTTFPYCTSKTGDYPAMRIKSTLPEYTEISNGNRVSLHRHQAEGGTAHPFFQEL